MATKSVLLLTCSLALTSAVSLEKALEQYGALDEPRYQDNSVGPNGEWTYSIKASPKLA